MLLLLVYKYSSGENFYHLVLLGVFGGGLFRFGCLFIAVSVENPSSAASEQGAWVAKLMGGWGPFLMERKHTETSFLLQASLLGYVHFREWVFSHFSLPEGSVSHSWALQQGFLFTDAVIRFRLILQF